ncbi:MAG: hypothetical protein IT360_25465 [Gemmatimonadaceae bacterium]|nr:hypothetical protein [Gemmatimonadaceae bacterium]
MSVKLDQPQGDNASRWIGQHFAADFSEVRTYHPSRDDGESDPYTTTFKSSDQTIERLMNASLVVALIPAGFYALVAVVGSRALNYWGTEFVVATRLGGHSDAWPRVLLWVAALGIPVVAYIYVARFGLGSNDYVTLIGE